MRRFVIIFMLILFCSDSFGQKEDYNWVMGNGTFNKLVFSESNFTIDTFSPPTFSFISFTNSSISNKNGELQLFSGGGSILNKNGDLIQNGDSLNPGHFHNIWYPGAYPTKNGALFLQSNINNEYYLFHVKGDTFPSLVALPNGLASEFLYTKIVKLNNDYIVEKKIYQL